MRRTKACSVSPIRYIIVASHSGLWRGSVACSGFKMSIIDIEVISKYLSGVGPDTCIYLGCDSERIKHGKVWVVDYTLAVVLHIDGRHGCKIFGEIQREADHTQRADKPALRLMGEVYRVADLYQKVLAVADGRRIEVHLDINPKEAAGSNVVISQAVGYIRGVCQVEPMVKPRAFAASCAADRLKSVLASARPEKLAA